MTTDVLEHHDAALDEEDRQFVTLTVADQLCGVPVLGVRDILGEQAITRIPLAPPEVAGSLNLRGRIVTAIDLRRRLGLPPAPAGREAHVGGGRAGRRTLCAAGRPGVRGDERAASAFERNPPTLPAIWARSRPASTGWRIACWWCSTSASCSRLARPG